MVLVAVPTGPEGSRTGKGQRRKRFHDVRPNSLHMPWPAVLKQTSGLSMARGVSNDKDLDVFMFLPMAFSTKEPNLLCFCGNCKEQLPVKQFS